MPDKDFSEIQLAEEGLGLERLNPDGDVILLVEGQSTGQFLVSSKILSIASPVFAKLFGSNFHEGMQMAKSSRPTIPLREDDPVAMRTILRILHHQEPEQVEPMNAERLAIFAIHCDKYDCVKALRPWILIWFNDFQSTVTAGVDHGYLLLAAHLFRSAEQFSRISMKAQTQLSPNFLAEWDMIDMLDLLPEGVQSNAHLHALHLEQTVSQLTGALAYRIEKLLDQIHAELHSVEGLLRRNQRGYEMQGLVCMCCGRTHPSAARKCHPCSNRILYDKYCTSDYRVAEYFAALRESNLWPSLEPFQNCSADEIALRISRIRVNLRHSCQATSCPLDSELNMLVGEANMITGSVKGLDLFPLHQTLPNS